MRIAADVTDVSPCSSDCSPSQVWELCSLLVCLYVAPLIKVRPNSKYVCKEKGSLKVLVKRVNFLCPPILNYVSFIVYVRCVHVIVSYITIQINLSLSSMDVVKGNERINSITSWLVSVVPRWQHFYICNEIREICIIT
jgi:hypothetical protein